MNPAVLEAARVRSQLDAIVVDNPRARQAHQVFDFLTAHGEHQGGAPKRCVLLSGPSQSGKSTILRPYVEARNTPERLEAGEIPVLFVDLKPAITTKGLAQGILEAIARHGFTTGSLIGSETVLLTRVDRLLEAAKVKLLIIDEFHHIQNIESRKTAWLVAETIKLFLIQGKCPIVLSGIETARTPFLENRQLSQRAEPPIELHKLAAESREDRRLFAEFVKSFVGEAERITGFTNLLRLLDAECAAHLHEITHGVLGAAVNLIKAAIQLAVEDGRRHLAHEDLCIAGDRYFVALGLHTRNPFRAAAVAKMPKAA